MLGMKKYPKDYVKACRARVEADLRAATASTPGKRPKNSRSASSTTRCCCWITCSCTGSQASRGRMAIR